MKTSKKKNKETLRMVSRKLLFVIMMMLPVMAFAQDETFGEDNDPNDEERQFVKRTTLEAGISLSTNGELHMASLSGVQYWGFGRKNRRFKVGVGARFNAAFGNDGLEYITAPANLTDEEANLDTVLFTGTQVNSLNLYLALRYDFTERWGVEANIDLAGFSFGAEKAGTLKYDNGKPFATYGTPTPGNLLLIGDNDRGNLSSEFLVTYRYKSNWKFKAGAMYQFTEYSLGKVVRYTNDQGNVLDTQRYRSKNLAFGVGVNYAF